MLTFPQLSSSAVAQLPNVRAQVFRTRTVETAGGVVYRLGDAGAKATVWTLPMTGLTSGERAAIEGLFSAAEGRLRSFTFLDPNDNLLAHSSDFTQGCWVKEAGLILTGGQSDAFGGTAAVRVTNPTGQPLRMYQEIGAPGSYQYCLSVYAKQQAGGSARLLLGPAADLRGVTIPAGTTWQRFSSVERSVDVSETVRSGLELAPLSEVLVYGMQLEAGRAMSAYKETVARSGLYRRCRFAEDELRWTTEGPEEHSVRLSLMTIA